MTTVVSRTFRSSPQRDALQTWDAIVELLTQGKFPVREIINHNRTNCKRCFPIGNVLWG